MGGCYSRIQEYQNYKSRSTTQQTIFHLPLDHRNTSTSTNKAKSQIKEVKPVPIKKRTERLI